MAVKVKERRPGEWWIYINHRGTRKAKKVGNDKRAATNMAKQIAARLAAGDLGLIKQEAKVPTFADYAAKYLDRIEHRVKASTWYEYSRAIEHHLAEPFGKLPITDITRRHVKELVLSLRGSGHRPAGVRKIVAVLSGILSEAVDDEVIPVNPATQLGKLYRSPDFQVEKKEIKPLTRDELARVLEDAKANESRQDYVLLLTLARTGLRIGEACGLRPTDIDFEAGTIHVQRSIREGRIGTPKNGKTRKVYLSTQLKDELGAWCKERLGANVVPLGADVDTGWLFSQGGEPFTRDAFRTAFARILKRTKVGHRRIHDLRHGLVSYLIEAGKPLTFIQEQAGHSNLTTTLNQYAHLIPRDRRSEVDFLDDTTNRNPDATKKPGARKAS